MMLSHFFFLFFFFHPSLATLPSRQSFTSIKYSQKRHIHGGNLSETLENQQTDVKRRKKKIFEIPGRREKKKGRDSLVSQTIITLNEVMFAVVCHRDGHDVNTNGKNKNIYIYVCNIK